MAALQLERTRPGRVLESSPGQNQGRRAPPRLTYPLRSPPNLVVGDAPGEVGENATRRRLKFAGNMATGQNASVGPGWAAARDRRSFKTLAGQAAEAAAAGAAAQRPAVCSDGQRGSWSLAAAEERQPVPPQNPIGPRGPKVSCTGQPASGRSVFFSNTAVQPLATL